jgi:hypothetical protein
MGNSNGCSIKIHLDYTNSVYFSGDIVSGVVKLNITAGKIEADKIYMMLIGEIGYETTRTVPTAKGQPPTETRHYHIPFYSGKSVFTRPKVEQKGKVYSQGKYSWPFRILLPDHLPPTLNQPHLFPHVRYYLQVVIDKPWYKPNTKEIKYITVFPWVNILQNPKCLSSVTFEKHNNDITLKGTLNKSGYASGETIHMTLEIENPRKIPIQSIELSILQSYRIGQNSRGYIILQKTLPNIVNVKDEQIRETFSVAIPSVLIPPSCQFRGGMRYSAIVNIGYMLKLAVKVQGILNNFEVDIPITLGTEPDSDLNRQQILNPMIVSYASNPEHSMFTDHGSTPSYNSVVQNTNRSVVY